jgi:hypothetical protein
MPQFTIGELKALIQTSGEFCISIALPTHRTGPDMLQDPIRFRNLVRQAEAGLVARGWRSDDAKAVLQPVMALDTDEFWQHQSDGLVIFCSRDEFRYYQVPLPIEEGVIIDTTFYLTPLLPLINDEERFYILTLSQHHIRLLEATRYTIDEINLTDVVPEPEDVLRFEQPERQVLSMGTPGSGATRRGTMAGSMVFHGHGAGDEDEKDSLSAYFHQVDAALRDTVLHQQQAPMILAGVESLLPIYRQINTYPCLLDAVMTGNPDIRKPEDLHAQAWTMVQPYFLKAQQAAIAQYHQLIGTGKAANSVAEIVLAAYQGRILHLFLVQKHQQWGGVDLEAQTIELHAVPALNDKELLGVAAMQTILNGGSVYSVEPTDLPDATAIAAVFRY